MWTDPGRLKVVTLTSNIFSSRTLLEFHFLLTLKEIIAVPVLICSSALSPRCIFMFDRKSVPWSVQGHGDGRDIVG